MKKDEIIELMLAEDEKDKGETIEEILFAPVDVEVVKGVRLKVQVGVLKRCSEAELPSLVATVESIGLSLLHKTVADARCTDVKYEPLYHAPHFRERKQFTGVVELTFKEIVRHEPHG